MGANVLPHRREGQAGYQSKRPSVDALDGRRQNKRKGIAMGTQQSPTEAVAWGPPKKWPLIAMGFECSPKGPNAEWAPTTMASERYEVLAFPMKRSVAAIGIQRPSAKKRAF